MFALADPFRKPPRWAVVPEMTRHPWVWHGVGDGGLYPFWGDARDIWRGADGTNQSATLDAIGKAGRGVEFDSSDRIELPDAVGDELADEGTVAFAWTHDGTTSGHIFDTRLATNDGWDIAFETSDFPAGHLGFLVDTGGEAVCSVDVSGMAAGELGVAVCRFTPGGTLVKIDVRNFGSDSDGTSLPDPTATRSATTKIGNQANDGDPLGAGKVLHCFIISGRSWSDGETQVFLKDPFGWLQPDPIKFAAYANSLAAAPGGIAAAVATYHQRHHNRAL